MPATRLLRALRRIARPPAEKSQGYVIAAPNGRMRFLARIGHDAVLKGDISFEGMNEVSAYSYVVAPVRLGYATTIGEGCRVRGPIEMGRYCQLGPRVCIQAVDHDHRLLTAYSSSFFLGGEQKETSVHQSIQLGHSVWCGYGSIVLKGTSVGNGAVIAAGAVVTKDVAPYQIVGGNPARPLKQRFSDDVCELIERSAWWRLSMDQMESVRPFLNIDLTRESERVKASLEEMIEVVKKQLD